eukprot:gnl/Trimastix_PCT/569.p1 GENE.gnl/Trimastix_PCT/569~~gnl/Trimastix_PCT/569.p1  ORF type:complete len:1195 (-),score=440.27 gnl/Trimastix_PCT/569:175-3759(-)
MRMRAVSRLLFSLGIICALLHTVVCDEIIGCGGFVRASSTLKQFASTKIDYSKIKVRYYSMDGILKDTFECAPNGYYFVPIYDRTDFKLKVDAPEGWSFEPEEIVIPYNDKRCEEDVNFAFTGFSISGQVASPGCAGGPTGVLVTLTGPENYEATTTTEQGQFRFGNLLPGEYKVIASHPDQWVFTKDSLTAQLAWGSLALPEPLVVGGYSVHGAIHSHNGEPVTGVDVLLYPATPDAAPSAVLCGAAPAGLEAPAAAPQGLAPLCIARTNGEGQFRFTGVPCGAYVLVPMTKPAKSDAEFDIVPPARDLAVQGASVRVPAPFVVSGFVVTGRVVDLASNPLPGAAVLLDGDVRAVTGEDGTYRIPAVQSGEYMVTATKAAFAFPARRVKVLPSQATLPEINPSSATISGRIRLDTPRVRTVQLLKDGEVFKSAQTTLQGEYAFHVLRGHYVVRPVPHPSDKAKPHGALCSPSEKQVALTARPVLDVDFEQAHVRVCGQVKSLAPLTGARPVVHLLREGAPALSTQADEEGAFCFPRVTPAQYTLQPAHRQWCWEKDAVPVTVGLEDIEGLQLVQTGYRLQVALEQPATLRFALLTGDKPGETQETGEAAAGPNTLCLRDQGRYRIHAAGACYRYAQDGYVFDTEDETSEVLPLNIAEYRVAGTIRVQGASPASLPVAVYVNGAAEPITVEAAPQGEGVYRYEVMAAPRASLLIRPVEQPEGTSLVYYPMEQTHTVVPAADLCVPPVPAFEARPALTIEGRLTPALEDVRVCLHVEGAPSDAEPLACRTTGADGAYTFGPLRDEQQYRTSAEREGYVFTADPARPHSFQTVRLAQIRVRVELEGTGEALPQALLSLSAPGYRRNMLTDAEGRHTFLSLSPDHYFLRPVFKEYVFQPASVSVPLEDGALEEVTFTARRVAFSLHGRAVYPTGEACDQIQILAQPLDNTLGVALEEATPDEEGHFRVRGLVPHASYRIVPRLKADAALKAVRTVPAELEVTMGGEDREGVVFAVLPIDAKQGAIQGAVQWRFTAQGKDTPALTSYASIQVELRRGTTLHTAPLHVAQMNPIPKVGLPLTLPDEIDFPFAFHRLAPGDYLLVAKLQGVAGDIESSPMPVRLTGDAPHAFATLCLDPRAATAPRENYAGPIILFLLLVGACAGAYAYFKALGSSAATPGNEYFDAINMPNVPRKRRAR